MPENHHRGILLLLLLLLLYTNHVAATRRGLHQPFFPDDSGTAVSPPSPPLSTPTTTTGPFFPFSHPTPTITTNSPPAAIPSVTIPANISGLLHPKTSASNGFSSEAKKVVILVVISLFALGTLLLLILLFRRLSSGEFKARSTSVPLFPAGDPGSTATKETVGSSSEALYLGTIVDSKRDECKDAVVENIPYRKLGSPVSFHCRSPDLQPLPPLSRQCDTSEPRRGSTDDDEDDDNQSFYSPRSSSTGNRRHDVAAAAQRVLSPATTPSYPSSDSTSPAASRVASPRPETETCGRRDPAGFRLPPPPSPSTLGGKQTFPSTLSSPSDVSVASESSAESGRRSFSGQTMSITGPPPPPPPPQKGTPWPFPIAPPPSRRPNTPSSPLVPPPRDSESAKADSFPEAKLQSKLNSTDSDEGSAEQPGEAPRPKLKPLHWDKVRACSDRAMVWDQLKYSSFQLNEEMIETLFVCNSVAAAPKKMNRRGILSSPLEENRVLDPKKSQNVAILLRALNVTKEEVCEALTEGNTEGLGTELLETLLKMAPTKEEELKLKGYKDDSNSKLGPAERFLKAVLDISFAFKRVDAMLYIANFDPEIAYLRNSFQTLEAACEELRSSRLFLKLLEAVLKTGNRMNVGTNRGDAHAFKLDTLLKLADVKGTDGKTTLLHFVVQEIIRYEGAHIAKLRSPTAGFVAGENLNRLGLQVISALSGELSNVKKAASMDSDVLGSYVSKLTRGLEKISDVICLAGDGESNAQFVLSMSSFKQNAEQEIFKIRAEENAAFSLVKEITEYFHGDAAREEAHPFRIFVIVRDFLDVLDRVCKDVGRMQDRTTVAVGTGCRSPVPVNTTFPHTTPGLQLCQWTDSDHSSGSPSS